MALASLLLMAGGMTVAWVADDRRTQFIALGVTLVGFVATCWQLRRAWRKSP